MPLYSQLIIALPKTKGPELVAICRRHAKLILDNGGVVRGIENHGIRPLPARAKRKYATNEGERYFTEARFMTATFDASPKLLVEVERLLRDEEDILRSFTTKVVKNNAMRARGESFRNPYLKEPVVLPSYSK